MSSTKKKKIASNLSHQWWYRLWPGGKGVWCYRRLKETSYIHLQSVKRKISFILSPDWTLVSAQKAQGLNTNNNNNCYLPTYLLTYSTEQSPSWKANRFSGSQEIPRNSPHFMEPEGSLPHSQVPATCPYPEPARSSPCPHIALSEHPS